MVVLAQVVYDKGDEAARISDEQEQGPKPDICHVRCKNKSVRAQKADRRDVELQFRTPQQHVRAAHYEADQTQIQNQQQQEARLTLMGHHLGITSCTKNCRTNLAGVWNEVKVIKS